MPLRLFMSDNRRLTLDLCLPVYNEAAILVSNVQRVVDFIQENDLPVACRVVILVNGSTDRTAEISQQLSGRWPDLVTVRDYTAAGKSRTIMAYADTSSADWWGFMDIDLAVDLASLPRFFQPIADRSADLVVASRFKPGASCSRRWSRVFISQVYNGLARHFLGTSIRDHQCGCKFISQAWWRIIRPHLKESNYFLDTELIAWTSHLGGRIDEIATGWVDNRYHFRQTKVRLMAETIHFLINLYRLRQNLNSQRVR